MKLMVTWRMHQGKLHSTLAKFAEMTAEQDQAMAGDHVKLIGRWHDLVSGRGVAIFEADDAAAMSKYALAWNEFMDLELSIVLDDDETRALAKG